MHQVRNPVAVAASLLNGQLPWDNPQTDNPFYREKARHLDFIGDPPLDVLQYMAEWIDMAEQRSTLTWPSRTPNPTS